MKKKGLIIISFIIILTGIATIRIKTNRPPEFEVLNAGKMLAEAQLQKAPKYATEVFQDASLLYNAAMTEWIRQNDRWILIRDYKLVSELAIKSSERSKTAINESKKNLSETEDLLERRMEGAGREIIAFEEHFGKFPLTSKHREEINKSKLLYSECQRAYKNQHYAICESKLDMVDRLLNDVLSYTHEKLKDYFKDYPVWNELVQQTIADSRKNRTYVVIIDKFSRELSVYKNGKILQQYLIELGANWVGDKMYQGDKSTPEGLYKIVEKKQYGRTKYHKALLLDYPNEEDLLRFSTNKKMGIIAPDANIGNLIEIHGNGGSGIDWTDGCIALPNSDMDEIFKLCQVGTHVTIVGSTRSLQELSIQLK